MSKLKYAIVSIITFVILIIVQLNIVGKINIFGVVPNLFIIYIAYVNILNEDNVFTSIISIIAGLIFDICFGTIIGMYALTALAISLLTPVICKGVLVDTKIGMMVYCVIITIIWEVVFGVIYLILNNATFQILHMLLIILITSVINALIVLIVHGYFAKSLKERNDMFKLVRRY